MTPKKAISRLVQALERPPAALKKKILARIDAEPPRVETDRAGGIVATNPAFFELCGYPFAEIRGRKPGSFLQGPETDHAVVARLRRAIRDGRACEETLVNYHKDGSPYRVRLSVEPMKEGRGVVGFRAVAIRLPL